MMSSLAPKAVLRVASLGMAIGVAVGFIFRVMSLAGMRVAARGLSK
jgi:hypothetical protein